MPAPGLLWVNSRITSQALPDSTFNTWYNQTHVPDILRTSQMRAAFRYKSIDPIAKTPYLTIYPVPDVNWLGGEEFSSIPTKSDVFPSETKECFEFVYFDTRFYEHIDSYEKPGVKAGPSTLIISAALTPAPGTDADFNAWYRDEHYSTLAACTGYIRTRRYKLRQAIRTEGAAPLVYLALHEFEGESLPAGELVKTAETEWAREIMGNLAGQEVGVYRLLGAWGDTKAKF